jgi:hypothetical protein
MRRRTRLPMLLGAVRSRRWLDAGLAVVVLLLVATAVAGPTVAADVGRTGVRDRLAAEPSERTGLSWVLAGGAPTALLGPAAELGREARDLFEAPVLGATAVVPLLPGGGADAAAALVWRDGACAEILLDGRCPAAAGEVLVPAGSELAERLPTGTSTTTRDESPVTLVVVGTWSPRAGDDAYWSDAERWRAGAHPYVLDGCDRTPRREPTSELGGPLLTTRETVETLPGVTVTADAALAELTGAREVRQAADYAASWERLGGAVTLGAEDACAALVSSSGLDGVAEPLAQELDVLERQTAGGILGALLLGLVSVGVVAGAGTRRRRHELALLRLRGVHGRRLLRAATAEALVVLGTGAVSGVLVGWVVAAVWSGTPAPSVGWPTWVAGGLAVVGSVLAVCLVTAVALREPVARLLRPAAPHRTGTVVVVLLAALGGVAVVGANELRGADPASAPPWGAGLPVLLGLAAGLVAVPVVRLVARAVVRSTRRRRVGAPYLAARRLARRPSSVLHLPLALAGMVCVAVSFAALTAGADWRHSTAALRVAGPVSLPSAGTAAETLAAARDADPDGRWLMTTVTDGSGVGARRRAYVDAAAWPSVAAPELDGTQVEVDGSVVRALAERDGEGSAPVAVAGSTELGAVAGSDDGEALDVAGTPVAAHVVARLPALPLVGTEGVLGDLSVLASSGGPDPVGTVTTVVARADTPRSVLAALDEHGLTDEAPQRLSDVRDELGATPSSRGLVLLAAASAVAGAMALVALVTVLVAGRPERVHEQATLRATGIRRAALLRAVWVEAALVGLVLALGGALAAWAATWATLPGLPLGLPSALEPGPVREPDALLAFVCAVVAAAVVALPTALSGRLPERRTRPAVLLPGGEEP